MDKCVALLFGVILILLTTLSHGLSQWYPHTSLGAHFKEPKLISFQLPITLYDEMYNNFKIYRNGVLSFEEQLTLRKKTFNLRKKTLIAPLLLLFGRRMKHYQKYHVDIYSNGKTLARATSETRKFFHNFRDYEAEQVIVVTWTHKKEVLHQTVIISNGKQTFLQLIYGNNTKLIATKAVAGISAGDGVRFTYFGDQKRRDVSKLFQQSNVNKPGRWAFYIGSTEGTVFQVLPANTSPFVFNRPKFMIQRSIGCYAMKWKSPFREFTKPSVESCIEFCRSVSEPYAMTFKKTCSCLSALYNILQPVPENICSPEFHRRVYSTRLFVADDQQIFDVDECSDSSTCSPNALCTNTQFSYQCQCKTGYFGNGKVCISKTKAVVRITGKFTGTINGAIISDADLTGLVQLQGGVSYLSVVPISEDPGFSFQLGASIMDVVGWMFASKVTESSKNGLEVVGDRFRSKIELQFATGEKFTATHEVKGRIDGYYFIVDTKVDGKLPLVEPFTKFSLQDYGLVLKRVEEGILEGETKVTYSVKDKVSNFALKMSVYYDDNPKQRYAYTQTFKVAKQNAYYDSRQILVRYQQENSVGSTRTILPTKGTTEGTTEAATTTVPTDILTPPIPVTSPTKQPPIPETSPTKQPPIPVTSPTKQPPIPVTTPTKQPPIQSTTKSTTKETTKETTRATTKPTTVALCGGQICHQHADCGRFGNVIRCSCREGYLGNGTACTVDTRIKCGPNRCSKNAECIQEKGRSFCICKGGYVGDGIYCEDEKECHCHADATCYSNGQGLKYCLCNIGYRGDGKRCEDINECKLNELSCGSASNCVNTKGSFKCICNKGYRKSGSICVDIPECTEQKYVCDKSADCVEVPGSYKCVCPEGFRFGTDGRKCVVECRRCLNGGICLPQNRCKCRLGYEGPICQWAGNEFLILARGGTVKRVSIPQSKTGFGSLHERWGHTFVAVDYDCEEKMVYWSDLTTGTINRVNYDGTGAEVIIRGLIDPQGLTVDWLGRNIFWTDTGSDKIGVAKLTGEFRKDALISTDLKNPRAIVCEPYQGKLFWTDWNRNRPRIEESSMDGSSRRVLVADGLALPNGLVIDYRAENLCWTDAWYGTIACIDFAGTKRVLIYAEAKYPFSLTIHGSIFYWTEWKTGMIGRYHKDKQTALPPIKGGPGSDGKLFDIKVVTPCPDRKNVCVNNGGCSFLCLMKSPGTKTCGCPDRTFTSYPPGICTEL